MPKTVKPLMLGFPKAMTKIVKPLILYWYNGYASNLKTSNAGLSQDMLENPKTSNSNCLKP